MSQQLPSALASALDKLERRLPLIARTAVATYAAGSPLYGDTAPQHLHLHMAHTVREIGRLFISALREGRELTEEETLPLAERARERAEDGLPAEDLLDAYLLIGELFWRELAALAGPGPDERDQGGESADVRGAERAALLPVVGPLLSHLHRTALAGVRAHQEESRLIRASVHDPSRRAARALLAGEPVPDAPSLELADAYAVLALAITPDAAEHTGNPTGRQIAGRRKVHRVEQEAARALAPRTLSALDATGGVLLVPAPAASDPPHEALLRLAGAAGADVVAAWAPPVRNTDLPTTAERTREVLRLAVAGGATAGVHVLDDVLLEYQLARPTSARERLLALAHVLRSEPRLLHTLHTYFENDWARLRTARTLGVHPNTVDNRLQRIAALTGADPSTSRGLVLLGAVLTLERTAPESTGGTPER
ncbi:PucR family transcriptional regulator [Streptomyces sp. SID11233]|nr:PucR family transcriptional regulator [Streptomyces sp. SID11233]